VDLSAPDYAAALDFYRDLFGWQGKVGSAEYGGYTVCTLNGKPVAGIGPAMGRAGFPAPPPAWITYFSTGNIAEAQQAITEAGGTTILPIMDVGTLGRMMTAADPTGAMFGVWQPQDFFGAQLVNEPNTLIWNELHTSDIKVAVDFYREVLGVEVVPTDAPGTSEYWSVNVNGRSVGGVTTLANDSTGSPSHWLPYFAVADPNAAVDLLAMKGGTVLVPPFDMIAGRMAVVSDAQGAVFALVSSQPTETSPEAAIETTPSLAGSPTLSLKDWDPNSAALVPETVKELRNRAARIKEEMHELHTFVLRALANGELVRPEFESLIPNGWESSPGSPAYHLRAAAADIAMVQEGTRCIHQRGQSTYERYGDRLCCSHQPEPHCEPPWPPR
jgi:predicted enzyme related to lactoylglutathione lyase